MRRKLKNFQIEGHYSILMDKCIQCDQREIWSDGLAPLDDIGAMACMECGGELIDITDLPETQEDLRLWMAQQDASITQVDIKRQAEEE